MPLLATKLKKALNEIRPGLDYHIKNNKINGRNIGCSGFVEDKGTGLIVYLTTDENTIGKEAYMCRFAESLKDFVGKQNHWTTGLEELVKEVNSMLDANDFVLGHEKITRKTTQKPVEEKSIEVSKVPEIFMYPENFAGAYTAVAQAFLELFPQAIDRIKECKSYRLMLEEGAWCFHSEPIKDLKLNHRVANLVSAFEDRNKGVYVDTVKITLDAFYKLPNSAFKDFIVKESGSHGVVEGRRPVKLMGYDNINVFNISDVRDTVVDALPSWKPIGVIGLKEQNYLEYFSTEMGSGFNRLEDVNTLGMWESFAYNNIVLYDSKSPYLIKEKDQESFNDLIKRFVVKIDKPLVSITWLNSPKMQGKVYIRESLWERGSFEVMVK
jgi:hypothetical protein